MKLSAEPAAQTDRSESQITEDELTGLADDKIAFIQRFSTRQPKIHLHSLLI